jgi:hypothetical protein
MTRIPAVTRTAALIFLGIALATVTLGRLSATNSDLARSAHSAMGHTQHAHEHHHS